MTLERKYDLEMTLLPSYSTSDKYVFYLIVRETVSNMWLFCCVNYWTQA